MWRRRRLSSCVFVDSSLTNCSSRSTRDGSSNVSLHTARLNSGVIIFAFASLPFDLSGLSTPLRYAFQIAALIYSVDHVDTGIVDVISDRACSLVTFAILCARMTRSCPGRHAPALHRVHNIQRRFGNVRSIFDRAICSRCASLWFASRANDRTQLARAISVLLGPVMASTAT